MSSRGTLAWSGWCTHEELGVVALSERERSGPILFGQWHRRKRRWPWEQAEEWREVGCGFIHRKFPFPSTSPSLLPPVSSPQIIYASFLQSTSRSFSRAISRYLYLKSSFNTHNTNKGSLIPLAAIWQTKTIACPGR